MSTIILPERFDFSYHATFSEAYPKVLDGGHEDLIFDFSKVNFIKFECCNILNIDSLVKSFNGLVDLLFGKVIFLPFKYPAIILII